MRRSIARYGAAMSLAVVATMAFGNASASAAEISVEGQWSRQSRNDVQSPNDASASRFALDDITGDGPVLQPRLQLLWPVGSGRHEVSALMAPLRIAGAGSTSTTLRFEGAVFAPGALRARYQFDSWRIGWRYRWIDRPDLTVRVGVTAKLRDASIELIQGSTSARKDNTGFVPLLHASVEKPLGGRWSFAADIDGLAGGPGYAVDAGVRLRYAVSDKWLAQAGARFLDGGADNDEVYAFARVTSLTFGFARRFP
jgi:hypothetical protein